MSEFQYLNGANSEVQDKQAEAYLYAPSATVGIAATGVIEGLVVTQTGTASGSVLIAAGACIVQGSLGQGADRLINDTQKTLDIFTANPVGGLPRNDIVVFDSVTTAITVIVGTPNASPTDPTVPNTAIALARLRHGASATTIPTANIDTLIVPTGLRQTAMPHKRFRVATGGSRAATTWNPAQLDAEADASAVSVGSVSGYIVTVTTAGLYSLEGHVSMSVSTFAVRILTGAATVIASTHIGSGASLTASVSTTRRLAAGATLQLQVYPTVALTVTADLTNTPSCLSVTRLSD